MSTKARGTKPETTSEEPQAEASDGGWTRREFVQTAGAASAAAATASLGWASPLSAWGSDTMRVGVIGCGGRGTGAARDALVASEGMELVALGDLFPDRIERSRTSLANLTEQDPSLAAKLKVTDQNTFVGFDAYEGVLAADVDLVILATPPAFRPDHLEAAVRAGKHIFTEKPVAVDPTGVRRVIAASELAAEKGLGLVAGTQRRHDAGYREAMARIHGGAIGEIVGGQVYWNQGGLWMNPREPAWSDMEWQLRNWLYFTWLSGDHIVEQHIHNIDVANWALDAHPVRAVGMGGRQVRTDPAYGHAYDHFSVVFEYPSGARVTSMCRQIVGCANHIGEQLVGTLGTSDAHGWIDGPDPWEWRWDETVEKPNPYELEHTNLVTSIRAGEPLNEGRRVAESTLSAIMGREAAYTGQEIVWDELLQSTQRLGPALPEMGPLPVPPVAVPGVTTLDRDM